MQLGDEYVRKARLYPALLTVAPLISLAVFVNQVPALATVVSVAAFFGIFYLMSDLARMAGKKVEVRLIAAWNGLPSTRALRHSDEGPKTLKSRRRLQVEALTSIPLPTSRQERADEASADDEYARAIRAVLARASREGWDRPLVHAENMTYGFRRNLRGLKPVAILIISISALGATAGALGTGAWMTASGVWAIDVVAALLWTLLVTDGWVKEQAEVFTEQLFVTIESMGPPK